MICGATSIGKKTSFGEKREITREEAIEYLTVKKQVRHEGRLFTNLAVFKKLFQ